MAFQTLLCALWDTLVLDPAYMADAAVLLKDPVCTNVHLSFPASYFGDVGIWTSRPAEVIRPWLEH